MYGTYAALRIQLKPAGLKSALQYKLHSEAYQISSFLSDQIGEDSYFINYDMKECQLQLDDKDSGITAAGKKMRPQYLLIQITIITVPQCYDLLMGYSCDLLCLKCLFIANSDCCWHPALSVEGQPTRHCPSKFGCRIRSCGSVVETEPAETESF